MQSTFSTNLKIELSQLPDLLGQAILDCQGLLSKNTLDPLSATRIFPPCAQASLEEFISQCNDHPRHYSMDDHTRTLLDLRSEQIRGIYIGFLNGTTPIWEPFFNEGEDGHEHTLSSVFYIWLNRNGMVTVAQLSSQKNKRSGESAHHLHIETFVVEKFVEIMRAEIPIHPNPIRLLLENLQSILNKWENNALSRAREAAVVLGKIETTLRQIP